MRFGPHLLDEIRARLPVSQVVARKVALKKRGREFAGLSPFKTEKTPSFFVNDQKGFYHCFATGEHGDIFTFVMKTEGLQFPEAVERLALEAGVELPKASAQDVQIADERGRLLQLVEASAVYFEEQLRSPLGRNARGYLEKRGLSPAVIKAFRIGYAPGGRVALMRFLESRGYSLKEMALSGMVISGQDIKTPYDRFRDRIMFPIMDLKGRTIAFGGRALDASQPAKYLNSPETPLFHKGRVLFNAHGARSDAFEKKRMIAVEGYMDVVALWQAGFTECVAPLGTAMTPEQISLMWRVTPEPILCFDGDAAGRKAAYRAVDTALAHLKAGVSLSFAFLPDGQDPDDVVRQSGASSFETILGRAKPLVDVLFEREWKAGEWTTPERRARLEQNLRALTSQIQDQGVRTHYEREIRSRLFEMWRGSGSLQKGSGKKGFGRTQTGAGSGGGFSYLGGRPQSAGGAMGMGYRPQNQQSRGGGVATVVEHAAASESLRNNLLSSVNVGVPPPREALIIKTLLNHPWLIDDHAESIANLNFTSSAAGKLRDVILSVHAMENSLDRSSLRFHVDQLGHSGLVDLVARSQTHRGDRFSEPNAEIMEVEAGWADLIRLHEQHVVLR